MPNQKLLDYIKDCQNQGFESEKITESLLAAGWSKEEISNGFLSLNNQKNEKKTNNLNTSLEEKVENEIINKEETKTKKVNFLSKLKIPIIVIFSLLIFSGLAYSFYYYYYSTPVNDFERIMSRSFQALAKVDTFAYQSALRLDIESMETENNLLSLISDKNSGYLLLNINGKTDLNREKPLTSLTFNLQSNLLADNINLVLETKRIDNKVFLKVDYLPVFLAMFINPEITNKWIELDIVEVDNNNLIDNFSQDNLNELKEIILKHLKPSELFIILEEKELLVDEQMTYYYQLTLNQEKMPDFLINVYKDIYNQRDSFKQTLLPDKEMTELDWQELKQEIIDEIDILELYTFKIWINQADYLPKKISLEIDLNDNEINFKGKLISELVFSSFNKPIILNEPSNTLSIDEVLSILEAGAFDLIPQSGSFLDDDDLWYLDDDDLWYLDDDSMSNDLDEVYETEELVDYGYQDEVFEIIDSAIIIFSSDTCPFCLELEEYIEENNLEQKISFSISKDMDQLSELIDTCEPELESIGVPLLWDEGTCLMGGPDIVEYLLLKINN